MEADRASAGGARAPERTRCRRLGVDRVITLLLSSVAVAWMTGCASPDPSVGREDVDRDLSERVGVDRGRGLDGQAVAELCRDGLDVREAGALALANDPEFLAALTALDVEHARFIQAGLLQNPVLPVLFPVDSKQFEATLLLFVDALWERPRRLALATKELETVAEQLVSQGLATFRDGQLALLDVARSREQLRWASEAVIASTTSVSEMNCIIGSKPITVGTRRMLSSADAIVCACGPSVLTGRSTHVRICGCRQMKAEASVSTSTRSRISG